MSEASPRPWRVEENSLGWKTCIVDANGNDVASCWGGEGINSAEPAQADAALIVDAVNERESLRDLVKRLAEFVNDTVCFTPSDKEGAQSLLRESRTAIGEDAP